VGQLQVESGYNILWCKTNKKIRSDIPIYVKRHYQIIQDAHEAIMVLNLTEEVGVWVAGNI